MTIFVFPVSHHWTGTSLQWRLMREMSSKMSKEAISELPGASVSKRVFVQNLSYEKEFDLVS